MAADRLLAAGHRVVMAEAKPSPARKFLMAGKTGLNLTRDEPLEQFLTRYDEAEDWLRPMLTRFGPDQVRRWAESMGQPLFTGSTGRVFPVAMKASPLLRAWLRDLAARGLDLRTRWRWCGFDGPAVLFDTDRGQQRLTPAVTVLALGGASWPRLGSDGQWVDWLRPLGVPLAPFQPSNMGFGVSWSAHMQPHFGAPLKSVAFCAGTLRLRGEAVVSARGLEGGGIYAVSRALREGAALTIDLFPDLTETAVADRLRRRPRGESVTNTLRKALGLTGVRLALALELARPFPPDPVSRAGLLKTLAVPLTGPHPMAEAISTAGGIRRQGLNADLMLTALPGVFAAGEMLDWEAPTGGYLLTACLATGLRAGEGAARWLSDNSRKDHATGAG